VRAMTGGSERRALYAGCDLGISSAKVVIVSNGAIIAGETLPYDNFPHDAADAAMQGALRRAGLPPDTVVPCLATGFGDKAVRFAAGTAPHITCLVRGLRALNPRVRTVIDVGGHTMRVTNFSGEGELLETAFVEECSGATGMFLETIAQALEIPMDEMAAALNAAEHPVRITNTCVVFAESEVISFINEGYSRYDVFAGVIDGVASKIGGIARRIDLVPEVAMVGGVAGNALVRGTVERHLGLTFADLVGVHPQVVGAFGAALLAGDGCLDGIAEGRGGV